MSMPTNAPESIRAADIQATVIPRRGTSVNEIR